LSFQVDAQTKTWTGITSTAWGTSSNWTPSGVPTATSDVVIPNTTRDPIIAQSTAVTVRSLTINSGGYLTVRNRGLSVTVSDNVVINGTLYNQGTALIVGGNWTRNGTYTEALYSSNGTFAPSIQFTGSGKTIGGTLANTFNAVTISGSTILKSNITVNALGASKFEVSGTLDPELNKITFPTSYTGFSVAVSGTIIVKAAVFTGNYSLFPIMYGSETQVSTVEYAANGNQVVAND